MNGFFSSLVVSNRKPIDLLPACGKCGLHKGCLSPFMGIAGNGKRKILIVCESPGEVEDRKGVPLVGPTGKYLAEKLRKFGIDMREDCWLTNALRCRPSSTNEIKDPRAIDYCRPNLVQSIKELNPEVIFLFGGSAIKSLIPYLWKDDIEPEGRWRGQIIPCQKFNAWICSTWHPSYITRMDYGYGNQENEVRELLFERHLKRMAKVRGRPFAEVPDYRKEVKIYHDPDEAAKLIRKFIGPAPVAFDYETDGLKPENPSIRIVCCSLSNGTTTIAFPWRGKAVTAMKEFLLSDTPKMGWNIKYESRFTKARLGIRVRNWLWDGMLAAHLLDNRPGVAGLKFQSFVQLGQGDYDDHIKPFLKADSANERNRIKEVNFDQLLIYCGIDSLLEWKIGMRQMEKLKLV